MLLIPQDQIGAHATGFYNQVTNGAFLFRHLSSIYLFSFIEQITFFD